MKNKKWIIRQSDISEMPIKTELSDIATKVLVARGIDSKFKIDEFIKSKKAELFDPFLLKDMEKACEIIKKAVAENKKIMIYGDYDVDGVTSTSILVDYFRSIGANIDFYIPDRLTEGYGLNKKAIDTLKDRDVDLIITVDSGITAVDEVEYLNQLGIDVIITDHHACKETLPNALAIINHKQPECLYPFKDLAGVGVAFKLVCALSGDTNAMTKRYSDIVAIGTIADVMPIINENRSIVSTGVERLNKTDNIGLFSLLKEIDERDVSSTGIGFKIAPRINAAGRMGLATEAVKLLLAEDESTATALAKHLCEQNILRQEEEHEILEKVLEQISAQVDFAKDKMIIVKGEDWHHGVVGIVSSRVIDKFNLPVIVFSKEADGYKGSARSIKGFNIFNALVAHDEFLHKYGGHELAAGMTVLAENYDSFRESMLEYASREIADEMLIAEVKIDCELEFCDINTEEVYGLDSLEPYGIGNAQPVFCTMDAKLVSVTPLSDDKHLKLVFEKDGVLLTGMLFSTSSRELFFKQNDLVSVAYTLNVNEYRGRKSVQMIIRDVKPSQKVIEFDEKCIVMYNRFNQNEKLSEEEMELLTPIRADFATLWRNISKNESTMYVFSLAKQNQMNSARLLICLDIFREVGLLTYLFVNENITIYVNKVDFKADLFSTDTYKKLTERSE